MVNRFFDQIGGIVKVKLIGQNIEKIINMAMARGIFIRNIRKQDDGMTFTVRTSGFKALQNISDENGFELIILHKQGLPFYKKILRRRVAFIGGAVLFLVVLYLMTSFIWFIDVSGNRNVSAVRILNTAARYGAYSGAAKWSFSTNQVEDAMLRDISELAYVRLNIQGVRAKIEVVEKILPSQEITGPCNMIASKDGVVDDVLVLEGDARVKKGDVVSKGDILIAGIMPATNPFNLALTEEDKKPRLVRARGEVKARVWYEGYGECRLKTETVILTGKTINKIYLKTPWRSINLVGGNKADFSINQQSTMHKVIQTPWGEWGLSRILVQEQQKQVVEYAESEAVNLARERAIKALYTGMGREAPLSDSKMDVLSSPSDPVLRVKVWVETVEEIAVVRAINTGENGN